MKVPHLFFHTCQKYPLKNKNNCKCCNSLQCCKLCKRFKNFLVLYKPVYYIFASLALNLLPDNLNKNCKRNARFFVSYLSVTLMHIFLIYRWVLVCYFRVNNSEYTSKTASFIALREAIVVIVWHSLHYKQRKVIKLFVNFQKITEHIPINNSRKINRVFLLLLFVICVFPIVISFIMTGALTEEEALEYEYSTVFGLQTEKYAHVIDFFLFMIYNIYLLVLPYFISVLYIFICIYSCKMIDYCFYSLRKYESYDYNLENNFRMMSEVFHFVSKIENSLSLSIFFVIALNLILSFTSFAYFLGYYERNASASSGIIAWFGGNVASFVMIVWWASKVNSESANLRRVFLTALSCDMRSKSNDNKDFVLMYFKCIQFDNIQLMDGKCLTSPGKLFFMLVERY